MQFINKSAAVAALSVMSALTFGPFQSAHAQAADYPNAARQMRIVVPYPAGGNTDIVARMVAKELSTSMGANVYIDNKPGAGGVIGTQTVVTAPADGYTFLFTTSNITVDQSLRPNLPYKPDTDLIPITKVVSAPLILMVNPTVPARNVKELVDYSKANPKSLFYSTYGVGSTSHIVTELFKLETGASMEPVPFKGSADGIPAIISNQVQVNFEILAQGVPLASAGKVRILAISGKKRDPKSPETPTMAEAGFPSFEASIWFGMFAPKGTPMAIVNKVQASVAQMLARPEVKARLAELSFDSEGGSQPEFAAQVAKEQAIWKNVISKAGIKITE